MTKKLKILTDMVVEGKAFTYPDGAGGFFRRQNLLSLVASMLSSLCSIRSAARQSFKRAYSTHAVHVNPVTGNVSAANAFLDELDVPPTAEDGYARTSAPQTGPNPLSQLPTAVSRLPQYKLHCFSSRNNTITTFTDPDGMPIAWYSGGSCGFKRGQRASYEAGYQCAVRLFKKIENTAAINGMVRIALYFKGFGQGRDAMQKALLTSEGLNVKSLIEVVGDRTPIKIGGTRAKKRRRL